MGNVLIIGNGARESALGQAFLRSPQVDTVYVAPGNAGMPLLGLQVLPVAEDDFASLLQFARQNVALTFIGPEAPLAAGIVDTFQKAQLPVFGPTQALAQLESSKQFAKAFMQRHHLPTAKAQVVTSQAQAQAAVAEFGVPVVIKVDGLAAGKGVTVAQTQAEATGAITQLYAQQPHMAVLIEECLVGQEASVMAMFNGISRVVFPLSQDHKRRFDHDAGPNTGGMGAFAPAPQFSPEQQAQAQELVDQTLAGMVVDGLYGNGVLYIGVMFTAAGPKILEYNLRFGDPETQVLLPQVQNDFYQLVLDLLAGQAVDLQLDGLTYCGVVAANPGYPQDTSASLPVIIPDETQRQYWYPAGIVQGTDGLRSHGGRIFTIVGAGADLKQAQAQAYLRLKALSGRLAYREDIGWHAL
ncbi:phosphoribosylamine--glycine ligase [Lacticaseibacillus baoqingensis]|uniref:Phosphoribosylamine--glycine ligase n=1 Tax=Lacticaseibacillus baoqingensis TaxID=2486013 RepID=A0ABW4E2H1_9LACO|nr:phosphoribosylamine--glycine ligase [Lacticaseibacillus baoqingensis]